MYLFIRSTILGAVLAITFSVIGQSPADVSEQFTGRLDPELSPDLIHVYQRKYDVAIVKDSPRFEPKLTAKASVSTGKLLARTDSSELIGYLVDSPDDAPFVCVDLNKNGTIEASERTELRKLRNDRNEYGGFIRLPIKNEHFKVFPVYFGYLRGFTHPKFMAGDTLTFQSVWAYAFGTAKIGGRDVRLQYPFEPTESTMSTTEGLFGIDTDGDGLIRNEEFSTETSYATKTEVVLRVGDMYVSTSKIDLVKNEITIRARPKSAYSRFEVEVGKVLPDFSFVDLEGKTRSLYEFRGKYVLIDFWGVWCVDCLVETPYHVEAYKRFRSRGFEILGLNTDEDINVLRAYVKKNNLTWLQARNDSIRKLIEEIYRIQEYPSTLLIGPDSKVIVLSQRDLRGNGLIDTLERVLPKR